MEKDRLVHEELTKSVLGAFFEVYNTLGFGFFENNYASALQIELCSRGHLIEREVPLELFYKGHRIGCYRIDMIVDSSLVIEIKSTPWLPPTTRRQLLNYLRGTGLSVGLVLHFGPKPVFHRQVYTTWKQHQAPVAPADRVTRVIRKIRDNNNGSATEPMSQFRDGLAMTSLIREMRIGAWASPRHA